MTDNTYNGWSNYETWRVNLEIFDGLQTDGYKVSADSLMDIAHEYIDDTAEHMTHGWAMAFINDVNWHEIAEHINEANEED